jgi:hypothetical protein
MLSVTYKPFKLSVMALLQKARVFVPDEFLQDGPMLASKARSQPLEWGTVSAPLEST